MNNHTIASLPAINRLNTKLTNFKCLLPRRNDACKAPNDWKQQESVMSSLFEKCARLIMCIQPEQPFKIREEAKQWRHIGSQNLQSIQQLGLILSKITLTVIRCLFVFSQIELFTGGGGGKEPPWFEHFQQRRVIPNHEVTDIAVRLSDKL